MFGVFGPLFILPKGKQHGSFSISLFTQLYGLNYRGPADILLDYMALRNILCKSELNSNKNLGNFFDLQRKSS
jgi:hypothetical protein